MLNDPFSIPMYFILMGTFLFFGDWVRKNNPNISDEVKAKSMGALEGLRGFLALSVFFSHAANHYIYRKTGNWNNPSVFYQLLGPNSVKLFFYLSGFLFWTKLIQNKNRFAAGKFFKGRALRILPAAWVSVVVVFLIVFVSQHFIFYVPLREIIRSLLIWLSFETAGINGLKDSYLVNAGVFWTLQLEWLFYFSLPILSFFSKKDRTLILLGSVWIFHKYLETSGIISQIFVNDFNSTGKLILGFIGNFKFGFAWGILAAWIYSKKSSLNILKNKLISFFPIVFLGIAQSSGHFRPLQSLLLFLFFIFVVYENDMVGLLTSKPAKFLGQISYSIYLLHGIVLWNLSGLEGDSAIRHWVFVGVSGIVTIYLSFLSYRYVELPFASGKASFHLKSTALRMFKPLWGANKT